MFFFLDLDIRCHALPLPPWNFYVAKNLGGSTQVLSSRLNQLSRDEVRIFPSEGKKHLGFGPVVVVFLLFFSPPPQDYPPSLCLKSRSFLIIVLMEMTLQPPVCLGDVARTDSCVGQSQPHTLAT